ncbi:MAG: DUF3499 family protein [Gaiellales bacterium]
MSAGEQENGRGCARSGCRGPALATLVFDYGRRYVLLQDLVLAPDPSSYDLCSTHAERFRPPLGWESEDRRVRPWPTGPTIPERGPAPATRRARTPSEPAGASPRA